MQNAWIWRWYINNYIFLAWGDGKIRAFGIDKTQTHLYEKFVINDAHHKGVTAITCTKNGNRIISGGGEGQVRIWEIKKNTDAHGKLFYSSELVVNMKEHKGTVSTIKMHPNDRECASASTDGTCIIWDLEWVGLSQLSVFRISYIINSYWRHITVK